MEEPHPSLTDRYETGRLAPYLRARRSAGDAIGMIDAAQPAGDMSDPPLDDMYLVLTLGRELQMTSDLGAGRFQDRAPEGALFLIPPHVASEIHVHNAHAIRVFALSSTRYRGVCADIRPKGDPFDFGRLHRGHFQAPNLLPLLERLWTLAEHDAPAGRLFGDGAALAILAELALLADRKPLDPKVGGLAPWQVKRIADSLQSNLARDVSLAELADLIGLTSFHLCRAFKASTGLPPHRWCQQRRMERAREMLEAGDLTVGEIAAAVGYAEASPFAAAFRKAYGASPSQYRRERRS
jgi:AraC family transcriptional regulator